LSSTVFQIIPPGFGLLGRNGLGKQSKGSRPRAADEARQKPGATRVGDETELGEGLTEFGRARGDDDVAGERDVRAGAGSHSVDRADDRHRQLAQLAHERIVVPGNRDREIGRLARRIDAVGKILARAKSASGAGQDQRTAGLVVLRVGQRGEESAVHVAGEGVEPVGPVERQQPISVPDVGQYEVFRHVHLPLRLLTAAIEHL
jgi:hypothetical protein